MLLVLLLLAALGTDGQHIVLHIDVEILFLEAGQLRLQLVGIAGIGDIGAEAGNIVAIAEEAALQLIQLTEGIKSGNIACVTFKRNQFKHNLYLH